MRREWHAAVAGFDAVLLPTTANLPPEVERLLADPDLFATENLLALRNPNLANLLGLCALTLPGGTPACGLTLDGRSGRRSRACCASPPRWSGRLHSAPQNAGPGGTCRLKSVLNGA